MRLNWGEWGDSGVSVRFVFLACGTALNIFAYELHKALPSEFSSNRLMSLEITRVTSGLMVMTVGKDQSTEGNL